MDHLLYKNPNPNRRLKTTEKKDVYENEKEEKEQKKKKETNEKKRKKILQLSEN